MGVHHAVLDAVRRKALAGQPNPGLARDVRYRAQQALAQLEHGLGGFGDE
jgi:hypothetical protein